MQVIRVTKLNDDGSIAFDGVLGPNEVRYLLENGLNAVMQAGVEYIEQITDEADEEDELDILMTTDDEDTSPRH
jgi:hypothetical protein